MSRAITLEALEVLDAIERRGSFAAAAEELYRVPSAISYAVQKLEDDLGVKLFQREGRRSVLTLAGEQLLQEGRQILLATSALAEKTQRIASGWEPRIDIAVDTILPMDAFFPLLARFYEIQPDIEFNLHEEALAGSWDALVSGRADLVIGAPGESPVQKGIATQPLGQVEMLFAVAVDHPLVSHYAKTRQPIDATILGNYRSVVVRDSSQNLAHWSVGILNKQPVLTVPMMANKIEAQRQGLGVGYLPRYQIRKLLNSGELVELPVAVERETMPLSLAWKSQNQGRALTWLREAVVDMPLWREI